jgi:ABC-2 type transport system ATP-binding protein
MADAQSAVHVDELRKTFSVPVREAGLVAAAKSLVRRESREIKAVAGVSFDIEPGEVVGFLGPNGAGKTTTLKMLSGLLYPTSGEARVLGHVPSRRERPFLRQITMVMGNRNQLQWDLPALDSFELIRAIYRLDPDDFRTTRDEYVELLDLGALVNKPVRNLSLGERMKMEFVAALLHKPIVLFLDEPTLGLDVTMQKRIRSFVAEYNRRYDATVLLTSHYMADVQALCKRVIVIHHGRLLFDGALSELAARFNATKTIGVILRDGSADAATLSVYGEVMASDDDRVLLRVPRSEAPDVATRLLRDLPVADLTIEDPPIDDVIEHVFATAKPADGAEEADGTNAAEPEATAS